MKEMLRRFRHNEDGATAIEYGLIACFITIVIIVAMASVGSGISNVFNYVTSRSTTVLDNSWQ